MNILAYVTSQGHPALKDNMMSLVKAMSDMGHEVNVCNVNDNSQLDQTLYSFLKTPDYYDMSMGFNQLGLEWKLSGYKDTVYLYEELNFPHVSIMLDEPFNHYVDGYGVPCRKHIVTYLDRSDLKVLDFLYPDKKMKKLFLPLGGTVKEGVTDPISISKEYDIVVSAGAWGGVKKVPSWHQGETAKPVITILDDIADILKAFPVSVMTAFSEVLRARGMYDEEWLKIMEPYFWPMLQYIKPWRRYEMLMRLVEYGYKVDIFGGGWDGVPFEDRLIIHGEVSYQEMLDVISKTKVLVQDEALFNDGAHDRVFTGMLNGAVVVSEYSSYLEELFEDQKDIFMFDWQNTKAQMEAIEQLIGDENYRSEIALNAYNKVKNTQTWKNRAERILEAVELVRMQG